VAGDSDDVDADVIVSCALPAPAEIHCMLWYPAWHEQYAPTKHYLSGELRSDGTFELLESSTSYRIELKGSINGDIVHFTSGGYSSAREYPSSQPGRRISTGHNKTLRPIDTILRPGFERHHDRGPVWNEPHRGIALYFVGADAPFDDSEADCLARSGRMSVFPWNDLAGYFFVRDRIPNASWIALRRSADGNFRWPSGELISTTFRYWATGEPSADDCVVVRRGEDGWDAVPCNEPRRGLCELVASTAISDG
jgi:hypothetical protein